MKLFPLIVANLKGFARNWRSVLLLVFFPILLIGVIFLSFNPDGIQKVPIGVVLTTDKITMNDLIPLYDFSYVTKYDNIGDCTSKLKKYQEYVCIAISYDRAITLDVFYDNTRDTIIWELISRIKSGVDYINKQESREQAGSFISQVEDYNLKIVGAINDINISISKIDSYVFEIDKLTLQISTIKSNLQVSMDDIHQTSMKINSDLFNTESDTNLIYYASKKYLSSINSSMISYSHYKKNLSDDKYTNYISIINVNHFSPGLYLVRIEFSSREIVTIKMIKN